MFPRIESSDDITAFVKDWIKKWKSGTLKPKDIAIFLGRWVPMQYDSSFFSRVSEIGIKILEEFMFFENQIVDFLKKRKHSSVCESIIEINKFYYECEECQAYEGRVLCVDCFNNSEHREHQYKIGIAQEIKFCNCGEEEAWKKEQQCTKHSTKEKTYLLPLDVKDRIRLVFEALVLLIGAFTTLYVETSKDYDVPILEGNFSVILYDRKSASVNEKKRILQFIMDHHNEEQIGTNLMMLVNNERFVFSDLSIEAAEALKRKIVSFGSSFVASIFPQSEIFVQDFIFEIIIWLQDILQRSRYFKEVFTDALMKPILLNNRTMIEIICKNLSEQITNERLYRLLISSSLKEYTTKKSVAEFILTNYSNLRSHTQSDSNTDISSRLSNLTPHLFRVPSLSHHLISTKNPIRIILCAFQKRLSINYHKIIQPQENMTFYFHFYDESLKALADLEYLLMAIPTIWSGEFRANFQNNMLSFLTILSSLEGMDPLKQKIGDHVEYERSWKAALTVQKKVGDCASLCLKWCAAAGSGTSMTIYQRAVELLNEKFNRDFRVVLVSNYSALCLSYNPITQPLSIYLPLTRFMAGLHLRLVNAKQTLFEPFEYDFISIIDPVLKVFVMIAQSNAGLWRRNGSAIEYRKYFYGGLRYRTEMLDRDIQLLQIAACRIEGNQFIIQLLEKFGLIDWVKANFEETAYAEEIPYIAEQFLRLVIQLIGERRISELSPDGITDQIKQEIIHALCIKPSLSHSELTKFIFVPGLYQEIDLDEIIDEVAVLKSNGSGEYELRKEFFDRYNAYFYHYTLDQLSESNNFQRQRRKDASKPDCLPPPRLPKLHPYFFSILNILQCDLMFLIMKTVLERSINLQSQSYTELQLQNVLYLIGQALQEEESGHYPLFKFTEKARKWQLENYLEQLQSSTREDLPYDLIKWTISKYKEVAGVENVTTPMEIDFGESEKLRKSKLATEKRAKIMADLEVARIKFMQCNINDDFEEEKSEIEESYTCILCQETQTLQEAGNNVFVIGSFARYSAVLCVDKGNVADNKVNEVILDSNRGPAYYTSSCGHSMHMICFRKHKLSAWTQSARKRGFDPEKHEFLCPLCQSLNNGVLPIMPPFRAWNSVELSETLKQIIKDFTYNSVHQAQPEILIMLTWKSLTYTLYTIETLLRDSKRPLLGPSSGRYSLFLESFVRTCAVLTSFESDGNHLGGGIEQLKGVLTGKFTAFSAFFNFDMLNILIVMTCFKTSLFETVGLHNLHLIFLAQIVKILFYAEFDVQSENGIIKTDIQPSEKNLTFQGIVGMLNKQADLSEDFIWNHIRRVSLPFLRCCALFHSSLTGNPTPPALTELGGDTFSNLCSFLGLPQTREDLLYNLPAEMFPIIKSWCDFSVLISLDPLESSPYNTDPYHINQLMELPRDYNTVIEKVSSTDALKPHICLVCTAYMDNCCFLQNGDLIKFLEDHKQSCGVGIYLNVCKCKIMCGTVTSSSKYKLKAPYVDDYNETDENFQRGNPLYLSSERYKQLHTLWLSNGIEQEISSQQRQQDEE